MIFEKKKALENREDNSLKIISIIIYIYLYY